MLRERETEFIIENSPPGDGGLFLRLGKLFGAGRKRNGEKDFKKYPEK